MGVVRIPGIAKRPLQIHAAFLGLWALLLFAVGFFGQADSLPWLGWILGLAPAVAGFVAFLAWRKEGPVRWIILISGEALGVVFGSTLLVGPDSPLMLLLLWPVAWAALQLPFQFALATLVGSALAYLVMGTWQAISYTLPGVTALGMVLYLATFAGVFLLLHSLESMVASRKLAQDETVNPASPPRSELLAPATVVDEDALHQDLRVARDIQVSLLLASSPRLPGWEASTSFLPARQLGGDLYDFVELDPTHWGIMIGDVSGKGIPAALHMAVARTLFRMEARYNPSPSKTLARINQSLIEQAPQGCVTLLYAHLNTTDGTLRLANAGHNYPFILHESARELPLDGLPLGIDQDYTFAETSAQLMPGDVLVFYTDGVVEAVNEQDELFGFDQLHRLLAETTIRRPRSLTRQIVRAVRAFTGPTPQSDDITLVVLRRRYEDPIREMTEVARDVLGSEGGKAVQKQLLRLQLPPDAPTESWRAAILTLGGLVRDRWGQGPSRELMQQLFLTLESF